MNITILHVVAAMKSGWHCWSELHNYGGQFVGTWREWLCK